jgi:hypothetical protein
MPQNKNQTPNTNFCSTLNSPIKLREEGNGGRGKREANNTLEAIACKQSEEENFGEAAKIDNLQGARSWFCLIFGLI